MNPQHVHPWQLVGPWYRWDRPGVPSSGRGSAPLLQMYESSDFATEFLKEPQHSLVYGAEDLVHRVALVPAKVGKLGFGGKVRRPTTLRKVYLDVHRRFYLVVCELHCDVAGFPSVDRSEVCEAGFVVRRRVLHASPRVRRAAAVALGKTIRSTAQLGQLEEVGLAADAALLAKLDRDRRAFADVVATYGLGLTPQGWFPSSSKGIGEWRDLADGQETPSPSTDEEILPLYPLVPDPNAATHTARGRTIWFGVLPTNSSDLTPDGLPRFDDRTVYEARAFVRRHKTGCPKTGKRGDCHGPLVWSVPSEPYQLAAPFDLTGTSRRPVTIVMPDLDALEAQAANLPFGKGVGVRMLSPPNSSLEFQVDDKNNPINGSRGGASICSFSIPLITIVASFVLRLFLPIVVLVFGLWFLLKLKFCIPPSFEIDGALAANLDADFKAGIDVDASLKGSIEGSFSANLSANASAGLIASFGGDLNALGHLAFDMSTDFSESAPPDLAGELNGPVTAPTLKKPLPPVEGPLDYYATLEAPIIR